MVFLESYCNIPESAVGAWVVEAEELEAFVWFVVDDAAAVAMLCGVTVVLASFELNELIERWWLLVE